ncbi:UTRA domain-containing protein [Streptomyces sp. NPDC008139]|uniref:GntR family transcriptional regulator n=1 Tax=Streptomyces sp. NPDC008139 TaxID=3364814 RepID=UPI0036EAFCCB
MADADPQSPIRAGVPEHGRVPKCFAVKTRLEVVLDELGEGGLLPTERELAARFEVARETVRQALRELLIQGRVRSRGRGTVVAGPKLEQPLSTDSYTEGVRRQGRVPGRHLIALERLPADPGLAAELRLAPGDPVWHMERVLLADEERVGLESTYLAVARLPHLERDFAPDTSFYAFLRERIGVEPVSVDERIETVRSSSAWPSPARRRSGRRVLLPSLTAAAGLCFALSWGS